MKLTNIISETAIITLKSRVIESQKEAPIIHDPVSLACLENIGQHLSKEMHQRIMNKKLTATLTTHIAIRARKYDQYTKEYIKKYSDALVVSLGCGFDTRYWRVSESKWNYIEIDLPDVIEAKKEILKDKMDYLTIGCSVLDDQWIDKIRAIQNKHVLFLAEGLFMYLPQKEVESLFKKLSDAFSNSCIVFETVNKKYTSGIWKKMVESKMKRSVGTDAGSSYEFGVGDAKEIESYGENIKFIEEWSYFEDTDIEPKMLWHFRNLKFFSRTQWTIKAAIG